MKLTTLCLCFFSIINIKSLAQVGKGSISVHGFVGFTSRHQDNFYSEDIRTTKLKLAPGIGYFVSNRIELGVTGNYTKTTEKFDDTDGMITSGFELGPYVRYYKPIGGDKFYFTLGTSALFGFSKTTPVDADPYEGKGLTVSLSPGFSYFLSSRVTVDFEFRGIQFIAADSNVDDVEGSYTEFDLGLGSLSPAIGFRFLLGKKSE